MKRIANTFQRHRMVLVFGAGACLLLLAASAVLGQEPQGAPNNINAQGKLTAAGGGPVTAGNYTFNFNIFNASAGGTQIWPAAGGENHLIAVGTDGLWNAMLGKDGGLNVGTMDDTTRWLEVAVTPPVGSAETFSRVKLSSNPFTLEAGQLNGRTGNEYVEVAGDVMTGRLQVDFGSNGTDIDLRQDGGTLSVLALSSGGSLKCQMVGGTKGHLVLLDDSGDPTAILDASPAGGGFLDLRREDGTLGTYLRGGTTTDGGTLDLRNSGGTQTVNLDTEPIAGQGGFLGLAKEDGTAGAQLYGRSTTDGANLVLFNSIGLPFPDVVLDAGESGGGQLLLHKENDTPGSSFKGGSSTDGGTIDLRASGGSITVNLDAQETQGGQLKLNQEDGTAGVVLNGGSTAALDGGLLSMYNAAGFNVLNLDALGNEAGLGLRKENGAFGAFLSSGTTTDGSILTMRGTGSPVVVTLDAQETQGGILKLNQEDGTSGMVLNGGSTAGLDGASLELYNSAGFFVASLSAFSGLAQLGLGQEDGTPGVVLSGGSTTDGATMTMRNAAGSATISLDADLTGTSAAVFPAGAIDSSEIKDEPGVASAIVTVATITLDGTVQTLLSRTINAPAAGYVLAIGTAQVNVTHINPTTSQVTFGVSDVSTSFPANQDVLLTLPPDLPSGGYNQPVTVHGLFSVNAGNNTFYFLADEATGAVTVNDIQFTLLYFPTSYGTVEPTLLAGTAEITHEKASIWPALTSTNVAAGQAEAEKFNATRIERELAQMKADRAELEARLQKLEERLKKD